MLQLRHKEFLYASQIWSFCFPLHHLKKKKSSALPQYDLGSPKKGSWSSKTTFTTFWVSFILSFIYLPLPKCLLLWGSAFIFTTYEAVSLSVDFTTFIFNCINVQSQHPIPYLPILFLIIAIFIQIRSVNSDCFHTDSKYLVCMLLSVYPHSVSREKKSSFYHIFCCIEDSHFSKQLLYSNFVKKAHIQRKGEVILTCLLYIYLWLSLP